MSKQIVKCSWTAEEDQILTELVAVHGPKKWSLIAESLPSRIGKQCRERWHNHLSPDVCKDAWTPAEDRIICDMVVHVGTRWATIAKFLPGRTDNAIKNRYYSALKKLGEAKRARGRSLPCASSSPPEIEVKSRKRRLSVGSCGSSTDSLTSDCSGCHISTKAPQLTNCRASARSTTPSPPPIHPPQQSQQAAHSPPSPHNTNCSSQSSFDPSNPLPLPPSLAMPWSVTGEHVVIERARKYRKISEDTRVATNDENSPAFVVRASPAMDWSTEGMRRITLPVSVLLEMMRGTEVGARIELQRQQAFAQRSCRLGPSIRGPTSFDPNAHLPPVLGRACDSEAEGLVDSMRRMASVSSEPEPLPPMSLVEGYQNLLR